VQVGVLLFFSWPGRRVALPTVYERALDRVRIMDTSGYDAVWLAEHHFNTYSVCPSVHMMATHVAAMTTNLRIGTAVSLAAMYHPLRLAEEVALLDVLSGGRVNWGAGRGNDPTEFAVFSLDRESSYDMFREHVDVVLKAWTEERLTYHGRFVHYEDVEVLPKPLQRPHPPVWMAASSPEAISWAAAEGHAILMDPHSSHRDIALKFEAYQDERAAAGFDENGLATPMARLLAVAPTDGEAEEIARQGAEWTVTAYANPSRQRVHDQRSRQSQAAGPEDPSRDPVQRYVDEVIVHGSPARVIDELQRLSEEMHLHYLLCAPLSHQSFILFTEKVLPALA
jgi:alkanesulfonate monooxygenase SsuD/methylene tetrahydromethanopterin reductase-like flavin-dependent oxidoreductase (luciferase family)